MDDASLARFSRQLVLPEIDFAGQAALQQARVGIVGLGGLGSPAALYLAAAGVGYLRLFDYDKVDVSNLNRQILFKTENIGEEKAKAAAQACLALNPHLLVDAITIRLDENTIESHLHDLDFILDATDNFESRFALNRLSVALKKPLVMGSAIQWSGQWAFYQGFLSTWPCYACVFPEVAETQRVSCSEVGIVGPVAGVVGNMMALLTIQAILKFELHPTLQQFDAKKHAFKTAALVKDSACPCCGE